MNSLSNKIGFGYLSIIFLNISLAVYAIYHINSMTDSLDKILKENYRNINSAENLKHAFTRQELTQLSMLEGAADSLNIENFIAYGNDFLNWHKQAYSFISLPIELIILDSLDSEYKVYLSKSDSLQKLLNSGISYGQCKAFHFNRIIPLASEISRLCSRLKTVNEQAIFEADNKAKSISYKSVLFIALFAALTILISVLAGIYFTKRIIKPLKQTTESVRKIHRGRINQKVAITTNDEIAELGIEFNSMTDRINRYIRDVSGLKELDRLKSDFMATISHEFKTPLTSINMAIDILQKEVKGSLNDEQRKLLNAAKEDVTRLNTFARDLLELSKLESRNITLNLQLINTEDLLKSEKKIFAFILDSKNIKISIKVDKGASEFRADKKQIMRVLSNLLDNAIRYSESKSMIQILTRKEQNSILFSIKDTGKGLDTNAMDFIFEKFVQDDKQNSGNIGLGLAISKEIVELHNGKIWAENNADKGCTFYFSLPQE